jgi:threonine synthase
MGDFLILRAVRESGGFAMAVADDAIREAWHDIACKEGLLVCPETAATFAAYKQALAQGSVHPSEKVVLFNCANGLKYPMPASARRLKAGVPVDWHQLTGLQQAGR